VSRDRGAERTLWLAVYTVLVLAPLALIVVADKPGDKSFGVVLAAGLGFAALTILALQLVMPSRARAFTAPFGIDVLLRFHRQIGMVALLLVVAHIAILVIDDPGRAALLNPAQAPWRALAGQASLLALVAVIATSLWRRPLRMSYELWRGLHVGLGLAIIAFAFVHVIGVSKYLATGTLRWVVLVFVVAAIGAVFSLRVARPFAARRRAFRVAEVRRERGDTATLSLRADEGHGGVRFAPGQFAWIKLADAPYALTENPFSFSSSALRPETPELTIRAAGDFTAAVRDLRPGTAVLLDGPHGSFHPADPETPYLLVAGGIGITPIMSILRTLADQGDRRPLRLVYANRTWDGVTFREELDGLTEHLDLEVIHVLSRPGPTWPGERGRITGDLLTRVLPAEAREASVFVCGPPAMVDAALEALGAFGVDPRRVHAERFTSV
jgi:predicted ferric reductase